MCRGLRVAEAGRGDPRDPAGGSRLRGFLSVAAVLVGAASGACVPLDDFMGDVFGRSMRDQRSFDPYEHTLLPPEGSVPFSAGNYAAGAYEVNLGQGERAGGAGQDSDRQPGRDAGRCLSRRGRPG